LPKNEAPGISDLTDLIIGRNAAATFFPVQRSMSLMPPQKGWPLLAEDNRQRC
jgi:hypothetical protein